jgi:hypothetical protein
MSNNITVGFSAKDVSFTETVKKVNKSTETIDDTVKKVSKSVGASFGSMVKAGAALAVGFGALNIAGNAIAGSLADFGKALDLGGTLQDLSQRTGETAGNLMILQRAFENSGSSAEAVGPMINKLQKFMIDASNGSDKNVAALKMLGLTYDELKEKSPTEQLALISAGFQGIGNDSQRTATAVAVFGKAGGELLPLLRNMSGEIDVAKSQLGSMPDILNRSAEIFDNISDNINVIKGKFVEFAAGLMDRMAPALELVTSLLSRIDTAAIGMRLGDVLTGGSNAMEGFAAALQAVNMGEFGNAFNLVFSSIKLQIADSINSIYSSIRGVMAAIPVLVKGSGIMIVIDAIISGIVNKISAGFRTVIADFLTSIGKVEAAKETMLLAKADEARAANYFTLANAGFASMGENIKAAMNPMKEAYDQAKRDSAQLVDTVAMENELQTEKLRLLKAQNKEQLEKINMEEVFASTQFKLGGERATQAEKLSEFERDISLQRTIGNKEAVKQLEYEKVFLVAKQAALEKGMTLQEATNFATQSQGEFLKNNLEAEKGITNEKQKQLTASQQMNADIAKAEQGERLDSSGKIKERFDEAMGAGNLASARRQARTLAGREENIKLQDMFDKVTDAIPSKINTSVADMAKELNLDTKGMDRKETEKAVRDALEKAPAIDAPGKNGQPGAPGEPKGGDGAGGPNKLEAIAEAIRDLVAKIEPKLPQMALGV